MTPGLSGSKHSARDYFVLRAPKFMAHGVYFDSHKRLKPTPGLTEEGVFQYFTQQHGVSQVSSFLGPAEAGFNHRAPALEPSIVLPTSGMGWLV